jgi:hypothetical protein
MALPQTTKQQQREPQPDLTPVEGGKSKTLGWIGWSVVGALLLAVATLVGQVIQTGDGDGSSDQAELARHLRIGGQVADIEDGFDIAEGNRFMRYAPAQSDSSHEEAESGRFQSLAPAETVSENGSFETNEYRRMQQLAP